MSAVCLHFPLSQSNPQFLSCQLLKFLEVDHLTEFFSNAPKNTQNNCFMFLTENKLSTKILKMMLSN